ncbi:threonine synthase, partial [Paracoccus sp. PXZ]
MRYVSTRGRAPVLDFEQAMMTGLARDGGLYLPEAIPMFSAEEIARLEGLPYEEVARRVTSPFVGESFSDAELRDAIA